MGLSKQIVYLGDFYEEAQKLRKTFGTTDKFSTGLPKLDEYMGGGFGRYDGYEVMLLYGPTGIGKSLVGLNILKPSILEGKKVGLMVLEDDMADVSVRLQFILGATGYKEANAKNNVVCIPAEALMKSWTLPDLLDLIESWYTNLGVELILLDHLQFAFEGAEAIKGENEYIAQRIFMQKLNQMMKRVRKTIILVSHTNKGMGKGMDKIVGSGAIAQAATKVIEVKKKDGQTELHMHKSRFTRTPDYSHKMNFKGTVLEEI